MTIRQKLFLILGISQIVLIFALIGSFTILIQSIKNEPQNKRALELSSQFEKRLLEREEFLRSILQEFLTNKDFQEYIVKNGKNRNVLMNEKPVFLERFKNQYNLNIMEIGDPDGKVFFRFHRPADFGDDKSHQPIIQKAILNKEISSTIEIGHSGIGLRAAGPLPNGRTFLIGQVIDDTFASKITNSTDIKLAFFKDDKAIAYSAKNLENILKHYKIDTIETGTRIVHENENYYIAKIPYESRGLSNQRMHFIVLIDETLLTTKINKIWLVFGILSLGIFSCILSVSYFFSRNIIHAIKKLNFAMQNIESKNAQSSIDLIRKDEIGEIGKVFISMKEEILNYQNHLEHLVDEKTRELNHSLIEIKKLKEFQDGDYYLTSLLLKPLSEGKLQTDKIRIDAIIRQKKQFQFRDKIAEIGGDLCVAQNIELKGKVYSVFLNADAMGKSIQGAGGALVLGTVFKSLITRTREEQSYRNKYPERWLKDCFKELQNVFSSFDGSMLLSAIIGLVDNQTGLMYFINAEHPWMVLYRDKKAEFIKSNYHLHKIGLIGLDNYISIEVFQMKPGDCIIIGSDGRDDILKNTEEGQQMNEDEEEFLRRVEESDSNLEKIENLLKNFGELTDDLTLMKIQFNDSEKLVTKDNLKDSDLKKALWIYKKENTEFAIQEIEKLSQSFPNNLYIQRLLGKLYIKNKQYKRAIATCTIYFDSKPSDTMFLYYLSYLYKQIGMTEKAIEYGERFRLRKPEEIFNLLNLAEIYILENDRDSAIKMLDLAKELEPVNSKALVLSELLQKRNSIPLQEGKKRELLNIR